MGCQFTQNALQLIRAAVLADWQKINHQRFDNQLIIFVIFQVKIPHIFWLKLWSFTDVGE